MHSRLKSHLFLFIVNLMYAINYIVAKGLMPKVIEPNGFILLRVSGASILFWLIYSFNYEKVKKKDFLLLMVCALFGVAVNQLFFFNGLMRTSPFNASVIMMSTPILVFILSIFILKERPTQTKIIGLLAGATGAILLFYFNSGGAGIASSKGDLLILVNAMSYSIYMVLVKPLMSRYNALTVITWVFTFGLIYVLIWPYSSQEILANPISSWSNESIYKILFVIVGVTFLPYLLTVTAMKNLSPSIASVYIYIQPVLTSIFIFVSFYLGSNDYTSDFSIKKILAALLVFAGVYLVSKKPKKIT